MKAMRSDFRPLSYYPLSLWSWQDAIKAVFLDRVIMAAYAYPTVYSPSFWTPLPSVVSLKSFVKPTTHPASVVVEQPGQLSHADSHRRAHDDLTFDHIIP